MSALEEFGANAMQPERSGPVLPAGACDCHVHVFGPAGRYPLWEGRSYTPGDASVAELLSMQRAFGLARVVLVQSSPYGGDNRRMVDALHELGSRARGVAVIEAGTCEPDLPALAAAGVCGLRANLSTAGVDAPDKAWALVEGAASAALLQGWHLQIFCAASTLVALHDRLLQLPLPVVIDHFGSVRADQGLAQAGLSALVSLVTSGHAYVKLSAAHRIAHGAGPDAIAAIAKQLIATNPQKMLWGSDWPHTGGSARDASRRHELEPFRPIDDGAALAALQHWCGDERTFAQVLVENPARLYGFVELSKEARDER